MPPESLPPLASAGPVKGQALGNDYAASIISDAPVITDLLPSPHLLPIYLQMAQYESFQPSLHLDIKCKLPASDLQQCGFWSNAQASNKYKQVIPAPLFLWRRILAIWKGRGREGRLRVYKRNKRTWKVKLRLELLLNASNLP